MKLTKANLWYRSFKKTNSAKKKNNKQNIMLGFTMVTTRLQQESNPLQVLGIEISRHEAVLLALFS